MAPLADVKQFLRGAENSLFVKHFNKLNSNVFFDSDNRNDSGNPLVRYLEKSSLVWLCQCWQLQFSCIQSSTKKLITVKNEFVIIRRDIIQRGFNAWMNVCIKSFKATSNLQYARKLQVLSVKSNREYQNAWSLRIFEMCIENPNPKRRLSYKQHQQTCPISSWSTSASPRFKSHINRTTIEIRKCIRNVTSCDWNE